MWLYYYTHFILQPNESANTIYVCVKTEKARYTMIDSTRNDDCNKMLRQQMPLVHVLRTYSKKASDIDIIDSFFSCKLDELRCILYTIVPRDTYVAPAKALSWMKTIYCLSWV